MPLPSKMLFEQYFDEQLLAKGSELYQDGRVLAIVENDKQLFTTIVKDSKDYEVEVFKPFTKSQKFSCECLFFKANGYCKHQIAVLYALRNHFQDIIESKARQKTEAVSQRKAYQAITVSNLLQQINNQQLVDFVRSYAKTDKKFALALKIKFASKIDMPDNEAKYKYILDSLVKPVTGIAKNVKSADVRVFIQAVEELLAQAGDNTALEQYAESFYILKSCINKVNYCKNHYPFFQDELTNINIKLHIEFSNLLDHRLSVELKEKIINYIKELADTSYYRYDHVNHHIIKICLDKKILNSNELKEVLLRQSKKSYRTDEELSVIFALLYHLEGGKNSSYLPADKVYLYESIINQLIIAGWLYDAIQLVEKLVNKFPKSFNYRFTYIAILLKLGKTDELTKAIFESYLATNDLRFIDLAKDVLGAQQLQSLFADIKKDLLNRTSDIQLLLNFYLRAELMDDLMEMLEKLEDFRYLMSYDKILYQKYSERLAILYEKMVESYLNTHVGSVSNTFIDELISHFQKAKMTKVINKVVLLIEMKFPHRSRLVNIYK